MTGEMRSRAAGEERYGVALLLIMSACIFIMAAPSSSWARVFILALQGGALVASARAAQASAPVRNACAALAATALLVAIGLAATGDSTGTIYVSAASVALVLIATPIITTGIIRQAKTSKQVTVQTMLGVLCIYLLMTLAFASAFGVVGAAADQPFFTQGDAAGSLRNYLYFSITTITTLGIGDFTPGQDVGRAMTAAESLIGQIYLVTVVAVIVGNLGRRR